MTRGGAGEQRPNSLNGLTAAANHTANIALSKLKSKNGCSAARNFREHYVVGIFDQLPNDELEKFSHDRRLTTNPPSHNATKRQANTNRHEFSARIKNPGHRNKLSALSAVIDRRCRSATFSITYFRSASVPRLPFLCRVAPAPSAFLPCAPVQVLRAVRMQLPWARWRPAFYFS